jgi:hypothetical protein
LFWLKEGGGVYENVWHGSSAEIVEGTIQRHFLLSSEQIRAATPSQKYNQSEYYDPKTNTYHFEGGYGEEATRLLLPTANWREIF